MFITPAPHLHSGLTVKRVMSDVMMALIPAAIAAVYFFGHKVIYILTISVAAAVLSEYIWQVHVIKVKSQISDMSAALTGFLFALTLPPSLPLWIAAIGSSFGIIFAKQVFGGLGYNPFNPALAGRAFVTIAWPAAMTTWLTPFDLTVTSATPLGAVKHEIAVALPSYEALLLGNVSGSLGETSAIALLAGGAYLLLRGHIKLTIPAVYLTTVAVVSFLYGHDIIFQLLAGGLFLGSFYMATDPVTSPTTKKGMLVFGIGCGVLTALIRFSGGFPEGVSFSILIMNMFVPIIDRLTIPKPFGYGQRKL